MARIPRETQGMDLAIEGNMKREFDNLNHETLIKLLRLRISDEKFLTLVYKMCKAGILDELQNRRTDLLLDVPQGAILSPFLCCGRKPTTKQTGGFLWNIYMHELDKYILTDLSDLIAAINKRQNRTKNVTGSPQYKKSMYNMAKYIKQHNKLTKDKNTSLENLTEKDRVLALDSHAQYKKYKKMSLTMPNKRLDKLPIRITYLRYDDDWILFTNGKPIFAQYLKNKIASFLKYSLGLSLEKTKITNLHKEEAKFLGFSIRKQRSKTSSPTAGVTKRVTGQKVYIGVDKQKILNRLEWRGFHKKLKPQEQPAWSVLSDFEIIEKYNSVIRELINYYAPIISYRSSLNHYIYILEYSCYKTLCQKHRTTIRKLIKNYGFPIKAKFLSKKGHHKIIKLLTCKTYWDELQHRVQQIKENVRLSRKSVLPRIHP